MVRRTWLFVCLALCALPQCASGVVVGVLGDHPVNVNDKLLWHNASCTSSSIELIGCSLQVYADAAATASAHGVQLLVMPEAYALVGMSLQKSYFFEAFNAETSVGSTACNDTASAAQQQPQQYALSCMARQHGIALATNILTSLPNGTRHITELVYDQTGTLVSYYHKYHLYMPKVFETFVEPGPFAPATFQLFGRTWGLMICYEGVYPSVTGDWAQMDSLVAQGATSFLWSVGGLFPVELYAASLANKYAVDVVCSSGGAKGVVRPRVGSNTTIDVPLAGAGTLYRAKPIVRIGTV